MILHKYCHPEQPVILSAAKDLPPQGILRCAQDDNT